MKKMKRIAAFAAAALLTATALAGMQQLRHIRNNSSGSS